MSETSLRPELALDIGEVLIKAAICSLAGGGQKKHFFYKIVRFSLNITDMFGIITTAMEMAV